MADTITDEELANISSEWEADAIITVPEVDRLINCLRTERKALQQAKARVVELQTKAADFGEALCDILELHEDDEKKRPAVAYAEEVLRRHAFTTKSEPAQQLTGEEREVAVKLIEHAMAERRVPGSTLEGGDYWISPGWRTVLHMDAKAALSAIEQHYELRKKS